MHDPMHTHINISRDLSVSIHIYMQHVQLHYLMLIRLIELQICISL